MRMFNADRSFPFNKRGEISIRQCWQRKHVAALCNFACNIIGNIKVRAHGKMVPVFLRAAAYRQYDHAILIKQRVKLFIGQLADKISHINTLPFL